MDKIKTAGLMGIMEAMTGLHGTPPLPRVKLTPKEKKPNLTLMPNHFGERRSGPSKCRTWANKGTAYRDGKGWYKITPNA